MRLTDVAATLLACGLLFGCSTQPSDQTEAIPSPSPKQSVKEPSPSMAEPVETPLSALPEGTPPKIGYAERNTHVAPDGERTRLRLPLRGGVGAFVQYRGGFVVANEIIFEGSGGARGTGHATGVAEGSQANTFGLEEQQHPNLWLRAAYRYYRWENLGAT